MQLCNITRFDSVFVSNAAKKMPEMLRCSGTASFVSYCDAALLKQCMFLEIGKHALGNSLLIMQILFLDLYFKV